MYLYFVFSDYKNLEFRIRQDIWEKYELENKLCEKTISFSMSKLFFNSIEEDDYIRIYPNSLKEVFIFLLKKTKRSEKYLLFDKKKNGYKHFKSREILKLLKKSSFQTFLDNFEGEIFGDIFSLKYPYDS